MDLFTLGAIAFVVYALYQSNPTGQQQIDISFQSTGVDDMTRQAGYQPSATAQLIGRAIAVAEGFYVPGTRPARDHNPGDMTADLIGKAIGKDGAFVVYANDEDGFANLYYQIDLWLSGRSAHANPGSTIQQVADFYTATQQDIWAKNVADHLGVSVDTPIGTIG